MVSCLFLQKISEMNGCTSRSMIHASHTYTHTSTHSRLCAVIQRQLVCYALAQSCVRVCQDSKSYLWPELLSQFTVLSQIPVRFREGCWQLTFSYNSCLLDRNMSLTSPRRTRLFSLSKIKNLRRHLALILPVLCDRLGSTNAAKTGWVF